MKKLHYYIGIALGLLALSSCSDSFLDKNPDERVDIDSEDKVVQLVTAAYPDVCPAWLGEIYSDNLIDNQAPHLPSSPNSRQVLNHYNYAQYSLEDNQSFRFEPATQATYSAYDSPGQLWGGYYNSIAYTNFALQAINKLTNNGANVSERLRAARGEASLIRAYCHFMLVSYFSKAYHGEASRNDIGVPYVTEIEDVVNKQYSRGNVYDVYEKIQQDLEAGLADISDLNFDIAPKYHFNTNAAHAFAARFYLFKRDYAKVIEHANAVLGTDSIQTQRMTMDYSVFDGCASSSDYANAWQSPSLNNNLMLLSTASLLQRRVFGYRYSVAGPKAKEVLMVRTGNDAPLWSSYIAPAQALVAGMIFGSSSSDYGYINSKVFEQFQYTNKLSGIGFPHTIYRAFTGSELLLERAEAKIMLGDYDGAAADLMAYWNMGLSSFSEADKKAWIDPGYTRYLTRDRILSYWGDANHTNCYENWAFAQQVGLNIPAAATPYMNCLNDFRRFENNFEGMRLLDVKRWGITVTHEVGVNSEVLTAGPLDSKLNIEVPWECLQAGMQSGRDSTVTVPVSIVTDDAKARQQMKASTQNFRFNLNDYVINTNK